MVKKKEFSTETGNLIIINEEEKESIKWMKYPREYEAREIMLKAHTDTRSHFTIQKTIQKIVEMRYKWQMMWDRCSINERFE